MIFHQLLLLFLWFCRVTLFCICNYMFLFLYYLYSTKYVSNKEEVVSFWSSGRESNWRLSGEQADALHEEQWTGTVAKGEK